MREQNDCILFVESLLCSLCLHTNIFQLFKMISLQNDLLKTCVNNPEILHIGFEELTPLTQVGKYHKSDLFYLIYFI